MGDFTPAFSRPSASLPLTGGTGPQSPHAKLCPADPHHLKAMRFAFRPGNYQPLVHDPSINFFVHEFGALIPKSSTQPDLKRLAPAFECQAYVLSALRHPEVSQGAAQFEAKAALRGHCGFGGSESRYERRIMGVSHGMNSLVQLGGSAERHRTL